MKINYMSDLHTEFDRGNITLDPPGGDLLVLAGDISVNADVQFLWDIHDRYEDIVLIDGNHEFYHGDLVTTHSTLEERIPNNVMYLEKEIGNIRGQRFLGTTLWGGYHLPLSVYQAQAGMNDHRCIRENGEPFTADRAKYLHGENVAWLRENIQEGDIVVTHHAPSRRSIDITRYGDVDLNGAYYDNLDELIEETKPLIWFHGHVHHSLNYMIGGTKVLCNPRGYKNYEENPNFDINSEVIL